MPTVREPVVDVAAVAQNLAGEIEETSAALIAMQWAVVGAPQSCRPALLLDELMRAGRLDGFLAAVGPDKVGGGIGNCHEACGRAAVRSGTRRRCGRMALVAIRCDQPARTYGPTLQPCLARIRRLGDRLRPWRDHDLLGSCVLSHPHAAAKGRHAYP
jgi:hypothetical protein